MLVYWENHNKDQIYLEEIELNVKGLQGEGFDEKIPQKIEVQPNGNKILKLKLLGGAFGC